MDQSQPTLPGPVFEAEPGWGGKINRWLKKNFKSRVLPAIAVAILLTGIAKVYSRPRSENSKEKTSAKPETVSVAVEKGDGLATLSRRALSQYLQGFPEITLQPEEKLQIENIFTKKMAGSQLVAGEKIEFLTAELEQAVNAAKRLSPSQRKKLRAYLR